MPSDWAGEVDSCMSRMNGCVIFEPPVLDVSSRRKPTVMSFCSDIAAPLSRTTCALPDEATATIDAPSETIICRRLPVGARKPGVLPSASVLTCVSVFTAAAFVARRVMYCAMFHPLGREPNHVQRLLHRASERRKDVQGLSHDDAAVLDGQIRFGPLEVEGRVQRA